MPICGSSDQRGDTGNTKHLYNIYTMSDQRRRRCTHVILCFVFAWNACFRIYIAIVFQSPIKSNKMPLIFLNLGYSSNFCHLRLKLAIPELNDKKIT